MASSEKNMSTSQLSSDHLSMLIEGMGLLDGEAGITVKPQAFGTADDWAWSAVSYLKCATSRPGVVPSGKVEVSIAAISILLGFAEQLAEKIGLIGYRRLDVAQVIDDLIAIRPSNWDEGSDPIQTEAWRAAERALQQLRAPLHPTEGNS
jgi:hypothetical protein